MTGITDRQREVLALIADGAARGLPPTIRELAADLGVTVGNAVVDHLKALVRKGYLERDRLRARALFVTDKGRRELASTKRRLKKARAFVEGWEASR